MENDIIKALALVAQAVLRAFPSPFSLNLVLV